MFSPSLTKVPSTSLGCDLAVKQVAYAGTGSSCPFQVLFFVQWVRYVTRTALGWSGSRMSAAVRLPFLHSVGHDVQT